MIEFEQLGRSRTTRAVTSVEYERNVSVKLRNGQNVRNSAHSRGKRSYRVSVKFRPKSSRLKSLMKTNLALCLACDDILQIK